MEIFMLFSDIHPFIRYARYLYLDKNSQYVLTIPYDARLFFCYSGNSFIQVKDTVYHMESGCILIIPAGINYLLCTPEHITTYIALNFDYTSDHTAQKQPIPPAPAFLYNPSQRLEYVQFDDNLSFNDAVYLKDAARLSNRLLKLEQEYSQQSLYYERLSSDILTEILIECARMLTSPNHNHNNEKIARIINYIHQNYKKNITNQEIGDLLNLHPNYINNIFKRFTGISLHQYILRIRISHAIELLLTSELSIAEIAVNCGFCDIYHFSKSFKKVVGIPPAKYRIDQP